MHPLLDSSARPLNTRQSGSGPVLYWMSRDQRVHNNKALLFAQAMAMERKAPLLVAFVETSVRFAQPKHYAFLQGGLKEVASDLEKHHIPFFMLQGKPHEELTRFVALQNVGTVVCDFSPLRGGRHWRSALSHELTIPLIEVDAHNIVPAWLASSKQEFAARTIRPKLERVLSEWLKPLPQLQMHPVRFEGKPSSLRPRADHPQSGAKIAQRVLQSFLDEGLQGYDADRNNPNADGQSGLSPFLHFGQISAQEIALKVSEKPQSTSTTAFLEELIIRRELSDNYCLYNPHYDSFEGFPAWAQKTLKEHAADPRIFVYTYEELENGETHDELWNAAQQEMVKTGKMHGYLRMYWAKKLLEWTRSPQEAQAFAIQLNDTYSLDGRDPNGYTGIAWSIGGVHDRPWFQREIFGTIRYMSLSGMKKKFDVDAYIQRIHSL